MANDAPSEDAGSQPLLVLVLDVDPAIRGVRTDVLQGEGLAVTEAEHGAAVLELLSARAPALILLDMRMPVMNGWQFAAVYRAQPGPHAPIVVITASQDARRWCVEIGGDGCLTKPFDFDVLVQEITCLAA